MRRAAPILAVVALALLPGLSLLGQSDAFLADPLSELPVKLWAHETFARVGILGAWIDQVGFPNAGMMNDPDPVGAVVTAGLRPLVGRVAAWNTLVLGLLVANALAAWALAKEETRDPTAAVLAAAGFALAPLVLSYGVGGAITDLLHLWPWPLALRSALRLNRGGDVRDGLAAGLFVGVGAVACPYNAVVFASAALPAVFVLARARPAWLPLLRGLAAAALAAALLAGGYLLWIRGLVGDLTSQMAGVAATRHTWPFPNLAPGAGRQVTVLVDWIWPGEPVVREVGSRYVRAFFPGAVLIALVLLGVARRRAARPWALWALYSIVVSTGPLLPLTETLFAPLPVNLPWLAVFYGVPGTRALLEPFRYALCAALALGVAAAYGAAALPAWARRVAPLFVVAELALVTTVPLPTATPAIPEVYTRLDALLGPGAVLELPYFDRGTDRFRREHFLYQLVHGRPIADEVMGYAPRFLQENQYTAQLMHVEKTTGEIVVPVSDPTRLAADRLLLAERGFAGVVVDPEGYVDRTRWEEARALLHMFGEPVEQGERWVWRVR